MKSTLKYDYVCMYVCMYVLLLLLLMLLLIDITTHNTNATTITTITTNISGCVTAATVVFQLRSVYFLIKMYQLSGIFHILFVKLINYNRYSP